MKSYSLVFFLAAIAALPAAAQTGFPFQDETLRYNVNWPSGLSLGDATVTAKRGEAGWQFGLQLSAGVPGFALADQFRSAASGPGLCSTRFERDLSHGARASREETVFGAAKGSATRTTLAPGDGTGKTTFDIPDCARDALAFLFYTRRELGQGRVPAPQQVYYGAAYTVRMDYMGEASIPVMDKPTVTDRVTVTWKGPKSNFSFDVWFARDAARTPVSVKAPLAVGTLTLELAR